MMTNRKLKLLKAVLLLRKYDRSHSKEEDIAFADARYPDDASLDSWLSGLQFYDSLFSPPRPGAGLPGSLT